MQLLEITARIDEGIFFQKPGITDIFVTSRGLMTLFTSEITVLSHTVSLKIQISHLLS